MERDYERLAAIPKCDDRSAVTGAAPVVLTVQQAARILQVSENHLYNLVAQNAIPHVRFGKLIRIPSWGLLDFIARISGAPLPDTDAVAIPPVQSVHVEQSTAKEGG